MKYLGIILVILLFINCNTNRNLSFLEQINIELENFRISEEHHTRLKIFHKFLRDNDRLLELENKSLLSIQDEYNYFINQKGNLNRHGLAHKDFLVTGIKEISDDTLIYNLQYENRTENTTENIKIAIDIYDMLGEYYESSIWQCEGINCLDGFRVKVSSRALELGMKIHQEDKKQYGFNLGDELKMSRFKISGIEINYMNNAKTLVGRI